MLCFNIFHKVYSTQYICKSEWLIINQVSCNKNLEIVKISKSTQGFNLTKKEGEIRGIMLCYQGEGVMRQFWQSKPLVFDFLVPLRRRTASGSYLLEVVFWVECFFICFFIFFGTSWLVPMNRDSLIKKKKYTFLFIY